MQIKASRVENVRRRPPAVVNPKRNKRETISRPLVVVHFDGKRYAFYYTQLTSFHPIKRSQIEEKMALFVAQQKWKVFENRINEKFALIVQRFPSEPIGESARSFAYFKVSRTLR